MTKPIFTEFAPLETRQDALQSLMLLLQPHKWMRGSAIRQLPAFLDSIFLQKPQEVPMQYSFFLTGRAGILHFLQSLNLPSDSEILVQGFTCSAVILPIVQLGYAPVYVDIENETYSMEIESLRQRISPACKVLILQHSFGMIPKHRNAILDFARTHQLTVLEDMAHGIDPSIWKNDPYYYPHHLLLSFGRSKSISSVFGGAIVTSDPAIHANIQKQISRLTFPSWAYMLRLLLYKPLSLLIKMLYPFGLGKALHKIAMISHIVINEISHREKTGRFDPIHDKQYPNALAVLLTVQLHRFSHTQEGRTRSLSIYYTVLHTSRPSYSSRYPFITKQKKIVLNQAALHQTYLGNWYSQPIAPHATHLPQMRYITGSCPVSEQVCKTIVNAPLQGSTQQIQQVAHIIDTTVHIQTATPLSSGAFYIKTVQSQDAWNAISATITLPSFLQSWEWGEFQKTLGYTPIRLALYEGDRPILIAQAFHMRAKRGAFYFIPHGPVFIIPTPDDITVRYILTHFYHHIQTMATNEHCSFIRVSAPIQDSREHRALYASLGYATAPIYLHSETMWELDIRPDEETLLGSMRKTTRYSVRKAIKDGVVIEQRTDMAALDIFYDIYLKTVQRERFSPFSRSYMQHEWQAFASSKRAIILLGKEPDGQYTAGALIVFTKDGGYYHQGASLHSKLPTAYLIQWEAIREAKRRGCHVYNFWGIYRPGRTPKAWHGLTLFKQGFGGSHIDYIPTQDKPLTPFYYLTYLYESVLFFKRKSG